jgi:hypothetical protein
MTLLQVIEGTPTEIRERLKSVSDNVRLTLIISAESEQVEIPKNLHHATPEERAQALDEIARMNKNVPVLPPEAYNR